MSAVDGATCPQLRMASLWPWLAVAGIGALHGLNPTNGWMLAAAWGVRSRDRTKALRALMPLAVGNAASVALLAAGLIGLSMDRVVLQALAGGLLAVVAVVRLSGRANPRARARAGRAGLALWSFLMSTAHGAGLLLVPSLIPLCVGNAPGRQIVASEFLTLLFAVVIHTAAMLAVTGVVAAGICHGLSASTRWVQQLGCKQRPARCGRPNPRLHP